MSFMFNTPVPLSKLWAASFKSFWKVFASVVVLMIITNFVLPLVLLGMVKISANKVFVAATSLLVLLILLYCIVGILLRANSALQGKMLGIGEMLQQIKGRYFPALIVGLTVFFIVAIFGSMTLSIFTQSTVLNVSPVAVGAMQAVITMIDIIVLVFVVFALPVVVLDNVGPLTAYKNSFVLAKDHWWRIFFGLVLIVLLFIATYALGAALIGVIVKIAKLDATSTAVAYSAQFTMDVIAIFVKVWALSFLLMLLNDLKLRQSNVKAA